MIKVNAGKYTNVYIKENDITKERFFFFFLINEKVKLKARKNGIKQVLQDEEIKRKQIKEY